jgi:hypothetical protein
MHDRVHSPDRFIEAIDIEKIRNDGGLVWAKVVERPDVHQPHMIVLAGDTVSHH